MGRAAACKVQQAVRTVGRGALLRSNPSGRGLAGSRSRAGAVPQQEQHWSSVAACCSAAGDLALPQRLKQSLPVLREGWISTVRNVGLDRRFLTEVLLCCSSMGDGDSQSW